MNLLSIIWDVDPTIFTIPGLDKEIRWYGLLWGAGFYLSLLLLQWIFKLEKRDKTILDSLFIYCFAGTIIGARLGHCFFYEPMYYLSNPFEIIKVWQGELASHGGAIGLFVAMYFFNKKHDVNICMIMDRLAICVPFIGGLIRLGNLMNHEIVGIPTDQSWGFVFMQSSLEQVPRHPAQLYEAIAYFALFGVLFIIWNKQKEQTKPGLLLFIMVIGVFMARLLIEFVKVKQEGSQMNLPLDMNMGQLLSIPFIIAAIIGVVIVTKKKSNV